MDIEHIKGLFHQITVWKRGGQRAPHKPLLVLYALSRCLNKKDRLMPYAVIDKDLKQLLIEFGPSRKSYHPEYPFWRLQNDRIWELKNAEKVEARKSNTDAKKSELLKFKVCGGFPENIYCQLDSNPNVLAEIVSEILESNFPASIHEDILQAVGLDISLPRSKRKRDPYFRDKILMAYEYECAVCGFNVRIGNTLVGLEAAHIQWHQAGGPDKEENGVALCSLHHKLFDRGAFSISESMKIHVSERAHGTKGFDEWLLAFHGKDLKPPQRPNYYPKQKFLSWHVSEVFQEPSRYLSA